MGLMGLFSKKESILVDKNALNIDVMGTLSNRGCFYLQTENGYITKETFKPENMDKVVAFVYGKGKNPNERVLVSDVIEFHLTPSKTKLEKLTNLTAYLMTNFGCDGIKSVEIKTASKKIGEFDLLDSANDSEWSRILSQEDKSMDEKCEEMLQTSCLFALSSRTGQ